MGDKLYLVTCRSGYTAYAVATSADAAYGSVLGYLERRNIGTRCGREMSSIELIADDCEYNAATILLGQMVGSAKACRAKAEDAKGSQR